MPKKYFDKVFNIVLVTFYTTYLNITLLDIYLQTETTISVILACSTMVILIKTL